ncbi:hypothetical protein AC1031_015698 [Aphanomyces cochlioides]|nr:hypothetical protein AC1031_015698 [Aphanomyces cochlioides]
MAVQIACVAWRQQIKAENAIAGFAGCGLWPLSKEKMFERLSRFKTNGVPCCVEQAEWMQHRDVARKTILTLPPIPAKKRATKRVVVGARILTLEELANVDATKQAQREATLRSNELKKQRDKKRATRAGRKLPRATALNTVLEIVQV